tara:strand:+ start:5448 stop:5624 length:177 start_codon:yes stop_codon:yes gene_type:complete
MATTTQYILTGIAAAGIAFWYDFKSWQNFGSQYDPFFRYSSPDKVQELEAHCQHCKDI